MTKRGPVLCFSLIAFSGLCQAQRPRVRMSPADVERMESALKANPRDRAARSSLLDYYFLGNVDPAVAIPARRRLILWLIENTPEDELAGSPAATIDPAGHALADARGFQLASQAWRAQAAKPDVKPATLLHAAYFLKTDDKASSIDLLQRAVQMEPSNKEFGARLGDEYALVILGVTMINKNGYPLRNEESLTESPLAREARAALQTSTNPYVLAKAGYMLLWQGDVLFYSRHLSFNPDPLAKAALDRAVMLAPQDREVAEFRKQYDAFQQQKPPGLSSAQSASPTQEPAASAADLSAVDPSSITPGMTRAQVLKLGPPSSRLTMDDDGHLVEIFDYAASGVARGRVRLVDGVVASVQK